MVARFWAKGTARPGASASDRCTARHAHHFHRMEQNLEIITADRAEELKREERLGKLTIRYKEETEYGARYVNVLLVAGYAAFFALWGGMADKLPKFPVLLSGAMMSLSLISFVAWEVLGMIKGSISGVRFLNITASGFPPDFERRWAAAARLGARDHARYMRFWPLSLGFSITTGFGGAALLCGAAFIRVCGFSS